MNQYCLVLMRPWEPGTAAIVRFQSDRIGLTALEARDIVKGAVTEWVSSSEVGWQAWKDSMEDFNIGDLCCSLPCRELEECLTAHGIMKLEVETIGSDNQDWEFDDLLVDGEKLLKVLCEGCHKRYVPDGESDGYLCPECAGATEPQEDRDQESRMGGLGRDAE